MASHWRAQFGGLLAGALLLLPAPAAAQATFGSSGTGTCVGVAPGGATDCRAVDVEIDLNGATNVASLQFLIPNSMYGTGMWQFEDHFGGASGQINPAYFDGSAGGGMPDDFLFGYYDTDPAQPGLLVLEPLFGSSFGVPSGNSLRVTLYFTEWMTEPTVGSWTYAGAGTSFVQVDGSGNITGTSLTPQPGFNPVTVTFSGNVSVTAGPPPVSVVPEPATVALLATGLLGLGGVGVVRRRRMTASTP